MKMGFIIVWIIFFILFLFLSIWHLCQCLRNMPHINVPPRPMDRPGSKIKGAVIIKGSGIDQRLEGFVSEFNRYVDAQNASSRNTHHLSAFGYGLAAATSFISAIVVI